MPGTKIYDRDTLNRNARLKMPDIASAMGPGWSHKKEEKYNDCGWYIGRIVHEDGYSLSFAEEDYRAKKICITGEMLMEWKDIIHIQVYNLLSIKVSYDKTPVNIANDIKRRLLSNYLSDFKSNFERFEKVRDQLLDNRKRMNDIVNMISDKTLCKIIDTKTDQSICIRYSNNCNGGQIIVQPTSGDNWIVRGNSELPSCIVENIAKLIETSNG